MSIQSAVWRPYTQHKTMTDLVGIVSGRGPYLYTEDGREILDLVSSWWVNIHGHAHPKIAEAIARQASELEHVIFAGFTHQPAEDLANGLIEKMGPPLKHVFYSDNGSTAVEVAIKIALQFAINTGQPKRKTIVAFEGGFHGDTWAAMAAGATSGFFDTYRKFLAPEIIHLPYPATFEQDPDVVSKEAAALQALEQLLEQRGDEIAGLLIEPLIQGAGGMRFCSTGWLEKVVDRVQQAGVKVIFDEVMTGFGRTGTLFAMDNLNVRPDIVCLSKGITGGFMPFSATVATGEIFDAFLGDSWGQALSHGHSYAGNPIACAAAVASLQLFETENTLDKIAEQTKIHEERLPQLSGTTNHRVRGGIAACELVGQTGYASSKSVGLRGHFLDHGLLLRPLGDTLYLIPPACVSGELLSEAYDRLEIALKEI